MRVCRGLEQMPELVSPVVAIGSFDGVHLGHRQILRYLCEEAHRRNGQSVVVTFDPHPQVLVNPNSDFFTINTVEENLYLIGAQGVDLALVIPFTKEFSKLSYVEFFEQYIFGWLHAGALVMGPNHAIGHNREGDRMKIEDLCQRHHVQIIDIPEFMCHDAKVHSSTIRKLILEKQFDKVDELLGYHYHLNAEDRKETFQNKI